MRVRSSVSQRLSQGAGLTEATVRRSRKERAATEKKEGDILYIYIYMAVPWVVSRIRYLKLVRTSDDGYGRWVPVLSGLQVRLQVRRVQVYKSSLTQIQTWS